MFGSGQAPGQPRAYPCKSLNRDCAEIVCVPKVRKTLADWFSFAMVVAAQERKRDSDEPWGLGDSTGENQRLS